MHAQSSSPLGDKDTHAPPEQGNTDVETPNGPTSQAVPPLPHAASKHSLQQARRNDMVLTLHRQHTEVLAKEREKVNGCCVAFTRVLWHYARHGPVGSALLFSFYTSSSLRCLYLACRALGGVAVATLFMSSTGQGRSRKNPSECNGPQDVASMIGRLLAIGVAAGILAEFPVSMLSHFHRRKFVRIETRKQWNSQLRRWFVLDIIGWILGLAYVGFCALYIVLFFANVTPNDQIGWVVTSSSNLSSNFLIAPFMTLTVSLLLIPSITVAVLMMVLKKSRSEVMFMLKSDRSGVEGEAHDQTSVEPVEKMITPGAQAEATRSQQSESAYDAKREEGMVELSNGIVLNL